MEYDRLYAETDDYFGEDPDPLLVRFTHRLDPLKPVLDIGAGQGRNSVYLARKGLHVDAIDPVVKSMEALQAQAEREKLSLVACAAGFESFEPRRDPYGGLLLFGLLQHLKPDSLSLLREKVIEWTLDGSLLFVTCFSTEDSSFAYYQDNWTEVGRNTFQSYEKEIRFFIEPNDILNLFPDFRPLHHFGGLGPEHRHGNGPLQQHARVEAVFIRNR